MAKPKYDTELFLTDIKSIFQDNLNAKIDQINLEKNTDTSETNDNFNINKIANKAWFLEHIPRGIWNYPQSIIWGLNKVEASGSQSDGFIRNVSAFIEVLISDRGEKINESTIYKLLRYTRSLEEVAMENFDNIRGYGQLRIDALSPTAIAIDGKILKAAGITVTALFSAR